MHTYLQAHIIIRGIGKDELGRLMYEMHQLPFLWFEAGGENYFCEVAIPLELANEALLHIKQATSPFEGRRRISIRAAGEAASFSITPELFDQKSKRWTFEPERTFKRVESILLTAKSSRVQP